MLAQTYRPRKFQEVVGQDVNSEILQSACKKPDKAPRSYILQGAFGTGKTTSARIFAKALNCAAKSGVVPCGTCDNCQSRDEYSPFYQEFDSSVIGNVQAIRDLKQDLFMTASLVSYRVIVFDEFHLASRPAQSALLKDLEEMPTNIFVLFCTTDVEKIIPTIRSRSVDLHFGLVPVISIRQNLDRIVRLEKVEVSSVVLDRIALCARGHVRDSVMLLDLFIMMGDEKRFFQVVATSELSIINLLIAVKQGVRTDFDEHLKAILNNVLDVVRVDFFSVLTRAIQKFSSESCGSIYEEKYELLAGLYQMELFKLLQYSCQPWVDAAFSSDIHLQGFLWSIYYLINPATGSSMPRKTAPSLLDRARKK